MDAQIKVRGFRVEPGEIEAALSEHPAVGRAVVACRPARRAWWRTWWRTVRRRWPRSFGTHLRGRLPAHMVPAAVVVLDALPLTPSGKVDRRALPAPVAGAGEEGRRLKPGTELETRLAALWQELLGVDEVGAEDNFFDLGGHSLLLIRMQARLSKEMGREVPVVELFQRPTVRALAALLQGASETGAVQEGEERGGARQAALSRRLEARRRRRGRLGLRQRRELRCRSSAFTPSQGGRIAAPSLRIGRRARASAQRTRSGGPSQAASAVGGGLGGAAVDCGPDRVSRSIREQISDCRSSAFTPSQGEAHRGIDAGPPLPLSRASWWRKRYRIRS